MFTSIARSGYASASTIDIALTSSSTSMDRLVEAYVAGEASVAGYARNQVRRDSSVGNGPSAITQTKVNPRSAAPGMTAASAFGSQPNLTGVLLQMGLQDFGGQFRWYAGPGEEIYFIGGTTGDNEIVLADALNRAYTQSAHMIVEEL